MRYPHLRKMLAGAMMASAIFAFEAGTSSVLADDAGLLTGSVASADSGAVTVSEPTGLHQMLPLASGKSKVITLPRDARDILVSDPTVANAVIRTPKQIYVTGLANGQTNIIIFDRAGRQIVTLDVSVEKGGLDLESLIHRLLPTSNIAVDVLNGNVVLSGSVDNAADAKQAVQLAAAFVDSSSNTAQTMTAPGSSANGASSVTLMSSTMVASDKDKSTGADKVINMLSIAGEDQVHLKVTVAEVQRNVAKQLGINLQGGISIGSFGASFITDNPFSVACKAITNTIGKAGVTAGDNSLTAQIQALDQTGMVRTLAEPTLTAISGESASFLAGGEFPVPTGRDQDGNITITYKPFGVSLSFTPVVLNEGRISLHVKTEVSELSSENAVQLSGLTLPSIVVRRSESVMELPSGGSMVMGGLLQDNIRQTINAIPALGKLPILGPLFRSRDFKRNETELVIIVTPYLVKPVSRNQLARPDDGFATSSDRDAVLLGRINRVYGGKGQPVPSGNYNGKYGFNYQ